MLDRLMLDRLMMDRLVDLAGRLVEVDDVVAVSVGTRPAETRKTLAAARASVTETIARL